MSTLSKRRVCSLICVLVMILAFCSYGLAKEKVSKEKKLALDWLSQSEIVEKFGKISDAIWELSLIHI